MSPLIKTTGFCLISLFVGVALGLSLSRSVLTTAAMSAISGVGSPRLDYVRMSQDDMLSWQAMEMAVKKDRNRDRANDILRVEEGEVDLRVFPLAPTQVIQGVVAVVAVRNVSSRKITLFEPVIEKLSRPSTTTTTKVMYNITCAVQGASWCRVLAPGQVLYYPVILDIESGIPHELQFALSVPRFLRLFPAEFESAVVARYECEWTPRPDIADRQ